MKYDYQKKNGGVRNSVFMLPICDNMHNTIHTRARLLLYSSCKLSRGGQDCVCHPAKKTPHPRQRARYATAMDGESRPHGDGGVPVQPQLGCAPACFADTLNPFLAGAQPKNMNTWLQGIRNLYLRQAYDGPLPKGAEGLSGATQGFSGPPPSKGSRRPPPPQGSRRASSGATPQICYHDALLLPEGQDEWISKEKQVGHETSKRTK